MANTEPRRTPEFVAQVRAMRREGVRVKAIAAAMGCAYNTVRITLSDGVAMDKRCSPNIIQEIRSLRAIRFSQREIMAKLGVPLSTVARHCKRFDEERREMQARARAAAAARGDGTAADPVPVRNSMEASLVARGIPQAAAAETARAWRIRKERTAAVENPVEPVRKSQGPFRMGGSHAQNMPETQR